MLVLLAWFVKQNVSLDEIVIQEGQIREIIAQNPWSSFLSGFAVYLLLAFVPGTGGKAVVWGWLFGFWPALITVSIGLAIAAMAIFLLSRYLFQAAIERRYGGFLVLMNRHLEKEGAFYLLTLRMAHAPFSIVNPVSGASRVRAWTFFWTTVVGLMPANIIWIYVGIRLPSLQELAATGPESLIDLPLILALIGCGVLPLLVRWLIRHFGLPGTTTDSNEIIFQKPEQE
ncbi:MAG: VTT domain-containing protein [Pseudohongiellaceae bacterium]